MTTQQEIERMVQVLKSACDRTWSDETPWQVANIAANAIYRRGRACQLQAERIATLEAEVEQLKEENEAIIGSHRALATMKEKELVTRFIDTLKLVRRRQKKRYS